MTAPPWGHKPPAVADVETYWTAPPPALSPRVEYWLKRLADGTWKPNRRFRIEGYYGGGPAPRCLPLGVLERHCSRTDGPRHAVTCDPT
jgi:hypothetical protein